MDILCNKIIYIGVISYRYSYDCACLDIEFLWR